MPTDSRGLTCSALFSNRSHDIEAELRERKRRLEAERSERALASDLVPNQKYKSRSTKLQWRPKTFWHDVEEVKGRLAYNYFNWRQVKSNAGYRSKSEGRAMGLEVGESTGQVLGVSFCMCKLGACVVPLVSLLGVFWVGGRCKHPTCLVRYGQTLYVLHHTSDATCRCPTSICHANRG
jgi:hypothetical protein